MRRTGNVFKLMAGGVEVVLLTAVAAYAEPGITQSFFNRFTRGDTQTQAADTTALAPPAVNGAPDLTRFGGESSAGKRESDSTKPGVPSLENTNEPSEAPRLLVPQNGPAVVYGYRGAPLYAPATVYRPAVRLAPMPRSVTVGRGVVGQPTVYVPGQPVRNFLRWLSP